MKKRASTKKQPIKTDDAIATALFALVVRKPFAEITPALLAKKSGLKTSLLAKRFKSPADLISFIIGYADQIVLHQFKKDKLTGAPKDQLFELIMARLDWLQKNRKAVIQIGKACWENPDLMPVMVNAHWISARKMLEILQISLPKGVVAHALLFMLYEYALQLWLNDQQQDMDKTMARLNRLLHKFSP